MKRTLHSYFSIFLVPFILMGLGCGIPSLVELLPEQQTGPTPTAILSGRNISSDYLDRLVWRNDKVYIVHNSYPSPGLLVKENHLAYVNNLGGPISKINQLTFLDGTTGEIVWLSERFGDMEDVAIEKENALVLLRNGNTLSVYETKRGSEPVSRFSYFNEPTKFYITPIPDSQLVYIYYDAEQGNELVMQTVDFTGAKIGLQKELRTESIFFQPFVISDSFAFLIGEEYTGLDINTGQILWNISSEGQIDSWPVVQDNQLIVASGDGKRYRLLGFDLESGDELWRTDKEYSSGMTLCGSDLFALRNDATVVRVEPTTGLIDEEIPFEPRLLDAGASAYWLVCNEQLLFIYFGDSQELFALDL